MKKLTLLLMAAMLVAACNSPETKALSKRSSSGKTCEVLVAADKGHYTGATKALIDSILLSPQEGLPQPEQRFSVVNVPVSSLHNTQMFKMHRNIIICDVKAGNPDKFYIHHDQWAEPQAVIDIAASSEATLCEMLRKHADRIVEEIYKDEYRRMDNVFYKDRNIELMQRVEDKYGFTLSLPKEFSWAKDDGDFVWLRKETKDFGLSVLVNVMPYRDATVFYTAKIYNRLDTMMRREVPGPAEGSYMGTERRVALESRKVEFGDSKYCIETRGLWRLFGDFMGGPFVSYCLLSPDGTQVVELTGFVYCPRFDKRDYLMQVDGICRSIKWKKVE
ncbi:MAG: DUF4837 family protein [Bacteroidales bacterium]|nr:DUF4837 family protein [Bacteroidales bacterium]